MTETRPVSLRLLPLPVAVLCAGLALSATSVLYELTHFAEVVATYQGESGKLTDPADAHRYHLGLYAGVAVLGALILAIAGLTMGTWLGRNSARILLAAVANPVTLAGICWYGSAVDGFQLLGADQDETFPLWPSLAASAGLFAVLLGSVLSSVLPLLPAVKQYCHAKNEERDSALVQEWLPGQAR
jgi:hypothetical protein